MLEGQRPDENAPKDMEPSDAAPQTSQSGEEQSKAELITSTPSPIHADPIEPSADQGHEGQSHSQSPAPLPSSSPADIAVKEKDAETEQKAAEDNTDKLEVRPVQETLAAERLPEVTSTKIELKGPESRETATLSVNQSDEGQPQVTEANSVQQAIGETHLQDRSSSPVNDDVVEQDGAELTPQQSSESLPTKPSGFLESLTANFAPDTKAMWAQIFGPRYEEDDEGAGLQEDTQSNADSTSESVASKSSLQAKLARERKLDEQIQASQRRYRERLLRNNTAAKRTHVKAPRRPQTQTPAISPLEQAGFSLTQIRLCTERALDETCKCFRRLRAIALEEAEDIDNPPAQGMYLTQGELEDLLRELFDLQESMTSNGRSRKGTLAAPLGFAQNGEAAVVEGIPMTTQLQASWFIPFGQLPQLRNLIMKITKRHLNEEKLAIVNRHLQKQLTLLPFSSRLQNLVVELSNHQLKEPVDVKQLRSPEELARDLLGYIAVNGTAISSGGPEDYKNLLLFLPVELVAKTQLPSVICAQRLVFFRFLIEIVAAERSRLQSKSTGFLPPPLPDQTQAKRRSLASKRTRSSSRNVSVELAPESDATIQDSEKPVGGEETTSVQAAHGSLPSTSEASGANDTSAEKDLFEHPVQVGDECEKPVSQLQQRLESAITQLRQTLPAIDSDIDHDANIYALNPAIRATYLAAVACHHSVLLMLENNIDVDIAMSDKLRHFIEALQAIQIQTTNRTPASTQLETENADHQLHDPPWFPPPYPESTAPEENDDESESGTSQSYFPPPYAITTPSYWTFAPSIPEPKSSIAKLASKSPGNKSTDLRCHFMAKESPGVGAYNIQQGDKLTFQLKPSYSFGPTGGGSSGGSKAPGATAPDTPLAKGSIRKPSSKSTLRQRMNTSLAFVPPSERNNLSTDARVHFASQYDDDYLRESNSDDLLDDIPPHYNEGDANEAPGEKAGEEAGETDMDRALRLQQRIFMDEFVQQVVSNQGSPTYFVARGKHSAESSHQSSSKSQPYWATSEVSPGIKRLLHRQRRAPSSSKFRASPASSVPLSNPVRHPASRPTKRVARKPAPSPPPRRQLDNDQHLAWAARISELYQPTTTAPEQ